MTPRFGYTGSAASDGGAATQIEGGGHRQESVRNRRSPGSTAPEPLEQKPGHERAQNVGYWKRRHEHTDDARTVVGWEPPGQIEDDAWKETRLGNAKQEADGVK
jgi:hypothetical protein